MDIIELYLMQKMSKKADLDISKSIGQVGEGENYKSILGEFSSSAKPTSMTDLKSSPHLSDSILRESTGPFRPESLFDNDLKNLQYVNAQILPLQQERGAQPPAPGGGAAPAPGGGAAPGGGEGGAVPAPGGGAPAPGGQGRGRGPGPGRGRGPGPGRGAAPGGGGGAAQAPGGGGGAAPAPGGGGGRAPAPGGGAAPPAPAPGGGGAAPAPGGGAPAPGGGGAAPPAPGGAPGGPAVPPGGGAGVPGHGFIGIDESKKRLSDQMRRAGHDPVFFLGRMDLGEILPHYRNTPLGVIAQVNPFVKLALLRREGVIDDEFLIDFAGALFRDFGGPRPEDTDMFEREVRNFVNYISYIDNYLMQKEAEAMQFALRNPGLVQRYGGIHGLFHRMLIQDDYFRHNLSQTWSRFLQQRKKIDEAIRQRIDWKKHLPRGGFFDSKYGPMLLEIPGTGRKEYHFTPQGPRVIERHN